MGLIVGDFEPHGAATIFRQIAWPQRLRINTTWAERMTALGLIRWQGTEWVHRSAGPPENPRKRVHAFRHATHVEFFASLDPLEVVRYRVLENPDKWPDEKTEDGNGFGGHVKETYDLYLDRG